MKTQKTIKVTKQINRKSNWCISKADIMELVEYYGSCGFEIVTTDGMIREFDYLKVPQLLKQENVIAISTASDESPLLLAYRKGFENLADLWFLKRIQSQLKETWRALGPQKQKNKNKTMPLLCLAPDFYNQCSDLIEDYDKMDLMNLLEATYSSNENKKRLLMLCGIGLMKISECINKQQPSAPPYDDEYYKSELLPEMEIVLKKI